MNMKYQLMAVRFDSFYFQTSGHNVKLKYIVKINANFYPKFKSLNINMS